MIEASRCVHMGLELPGRPGVYIELVQLGLYPKGSFRVTLFPGNGLVTSAGHSGVLALAARLGIFSLRF